MSLGGDDGYGNDFGSQESGRAGGRHAAIDPHPPARRRRRRLRRPRAAAAGPASPAAT